MLRGVRSGTVRFSSLILPALYYELVVLPFAILSYFLAAYLLCFRSSYHTNFKTLFFALSVEVVLLVVVRLTLLIISFAEIGMLSASYYARRLSHDTSLDEPHSASR